MDCWLERVKMMESDMKRKREMKRRHKEKHITLKLQMLDLGKNIVILSITSFHN